MSDRSAPPGRAPNPTGDVLDITAETCPMTFVRVKLAVEKMAPGEILDVRLKGAEPLRNVPRSLTEHGHTVLELHPETPGKPGPLTPYRLRVRKEAPREKT
ncbi:MAG: sulfurtransferase TusA family protein [Alphaproteobacteria bacterium]|nr:sulfurtransferase TusA family protein [Alphaproteobacteria bacterium]